MKRCRTEADYRAKLLASIKVSDAGCWEWQGYRLRGNYGQMYYRSKCWVTHRLAYHLFKGPIPKGLGVCHSCDNKACCNPDHLWLGDRTANMRDLQAKGLHPRRLKTHCPNGHSYAEHGVLGGNGYRACGLCLEIKGKREWQEFKGARRGPRKPKTHCPHGHELAGDNLYVDPRGRRRCRACRVKSVKQSFARYAEGKSATQLLLNTVSGDASHG
jgi:hypothetical protein